MTRLTKNIGQSVVLMETKPIKPAAPRATAFTLNRAIMAPPMAAVPMPM